MPMIGRTISRYRISEKLGRGGMGVVYKAEDLKLERPVALKFLPEEISSDRNAMQRFRLEAQAASAMNHPNICTIYDIDEHDGRPFIAMEFMEGETLNRRIASGRLKAEEIVDLGIQMADALDAAHGVGIIHRDIKPTNIFLTRHGKVKILDFGLAKLLPVRKANANDGSGLATETADRALTSPGAIPGTLDYMSPEQARGKDLDPRTDLFSLGVVLYEMSTGTLPFRESSPAATLDALLHKTPTAPGRINPDLPAELERIINKATGKNPNLRYQHAIDMRAALERLKHDYDACRTGTVEAPFPKEASDAVNRRRIITAAGLLVILALIFGLNPWDLRDRFFGETVAPRHIESLAVLPFENLSGDPGQEDFLNGMTEALITDLSRIKTFKKVIQRPSVMRYKGTMMPIRQIAGELGVDVLIKGSALQKGNRVRITVRVIDGDAGARLWAGTFERDSKDILALYSDVAFAIVQQVNAVLSPEEAESLAARETVNPEAYGYYMRGRQYASRGEKEQDQLLAIQMFETAIQLDPGFAQAYSGLSIIHSLIWWLNYDRRRERMDQAKAALDRAVQLEPDLPETHIAKAFYCFWCLYELDPALREFEAARKAIPNDDLTCWGLGLLLRRQGKMEQSAASLRKAVDLNPSSGIYADYAGVTYSLLRNLEEADRYYDLALRNSPDRTLVYFSKVQTILRLAGDIPRARAGMEPALRLKLGNDPLIAYSRVLIDLYDGNFNDALRQLSSEPWGTMPLWRSLLQAQIYGQTKQSQTERSCYESAVRILKLMIEKQPEEAQNHGYLGIAYAGLGRKQEAIREGKAAVNMIPVSKDALAGLHQVETLARIYAMVGAKDEAIRLLEYLMSIPGNLGVGALRLDPAWEPLRGHPKFRALLQKSGW